MLDLDFVYDDDDVISDAIICFYDSCDCKFEIKDVIYKYVNDRGFYDFVQKNFLISKIGVSYLLKLLNDYDGDSVMDDYYYITSVNTSRWI
jgi:hypothetical protein